MKFPFVIEPQIDCCIARGGENVAGCCEGGAGCATTIGWNGLLRLALGIDDPGLTCRSVAELCLELVLTAFGNEWYSDGAVFMVVASLRLACSKSSALAQQLRHDSERNRISRQYQCISTYIWEKVCGQGQGININEGTHQYSSSAEVFRYPGPPQQTN